MSTDFSLLTAELTIDLEETENEDLPTPIQEYVDAKKLAFASRYQPLKEKDLHFNISDRILIHDLTVDALERLENHLNLEEVGTMLNWQSVAAKLGLNMDSIEGLFNVYGHTRGVMVKCSNMPLNKLIKALVEVRRIDTLYTLYGLYMEEKLFKVLEKPSLPLDYSAASTAIVSSKHVPRLMESGSILVVSYCSGKREERNVDHLLQHFVHPKYNTTNKPVYLVGDVVSDENIEQSAVEALRKAEHVVFCFTPSLLDLINNAETSPLDFKSRSVASISRMANEEYWAQKNRNTRFRAVTFDRFPLDLKTVGWAKATIEYKFPTQAQMFFKRIFENVLIS